MNDVQKFLCSNPVYKVLDREQIIEQVWDIKERESEKLKEQLNQEKQRREDAEKALKFYAESADVFEGYSVDDLSMVRSNHLVEVEIYGKTARTHFEKYKQ